MYTPKGLDTCYSAAYTSLLYNRDQQCFTISEVAVDWNEPIMPRPAAHYVAIHSRANGHGPTVQLADTHIAPIKRLSWPEHIVG